MATIYGVNKGRPPVLAMPNLLSRIAALALCGLAVLVTPVTARPWIPDPIEHSFMAGDDEDRGNESAAAAPMWFDLSVHPHAVSPDGSAIAAIVTPGRCGILDTGEGTVFACPGAAIYLVAPDGALLEEIVPAEASVALGELAWMPDGRSLMFEAYRIGDDEVLVRVDSRTLALPPAIAAADRHP